MTDPHSKGGALANGDAHIIFENLEKRYVGSKDGCAALSDVSLTVSRGDIFGIIGRSGAGKSTLLRAINMLEAPSAGRVLINGVDIGGLNEDGLVGLRRRIGMIFQHFNLLSAKTVRQNIGLPLLVAGVKPDIIKTRVESMLALVGLRDKADTYPAKLSGGQKQRVGIARALVSDPEILLCDESTSSLDPETTASILALLRDIHRKLGLTIVLITHDMGVIKEICTRVAVLDNGRVIEEGAVGAVFGNPQGDATRALLGTLHKDVPLELSERLDARYSGQCSQAVFSVRFPGYTETAGVPLYALASLGPNARLLHARLEHIGGHAQGNLLVSIPYDPDDPRHDPVPSFANVLAWHVRCAERSAQRSQRDIFGFCFRRCFIDTSMPLGKPS